MPEPAHKTSVRGPGWAFVLVAAAALAIVAVTYVRTWTPGYGLTRMIPIGWEFNQRGIAAYRAAPKYVPPDRWGFDGQLYAELAVDPLLRDPHLSTALDDPPYRAQRILLSWLAWMGGLGHPSWILNVYAALNGVFWLGYLAILWRLFRPLGWAGVGGFAAMLLTCGVVESMDRTLTDFPAFVLLTLAAMTTGIATGFWLALSGLTREVNLLGFVALADLRPPWGRALRRNLLVGAVAGLPVLLWYFYVASRFPAKGAVIGNNLDWPLHAIFQRSHDVIAASRQGGLVWSQFYLRGTEMHVLLTLIATVTQCAYVLTHPKWENRIWRVGAVFVPFFLCVSSNVWGGFAYFTVTRHALPITLAFNLVLALRPSRRWLLWFVLGNCFVPAGVYDFVKFGEQRPQVPEYTVEGPAVVHEKLSVRYVTGWSGSERDARTTWRWTINRKADLILANGTGSPLEVVLLFDARSLESRDLRVVAGDAVVWTGQLSSHLAPTAVHPAKIILPPGDTRVTVETSQPLTPPGPDDPRSLGVMVAGLKVAAPVVYEPR